jgi:hypothetical protein
VSFTAITLCVASQRVIPKVDSVRELLDTPSYLRVGEVVTLLSRSRKESNSNLGPDTNHPEICRNFRWYFHVNSGMVSSNSPRPFPPRSIQIHQKKIVAFNFGREKVRVQSGVQAYRALCACLKIKYL